MTKQNLRIFGVSFFFKLQSNTETTAKQWKMGCRILMVTEHQNNRTKQLNQKQATIYPESHFSLFKCCVVL